ncbi:hypothetical protein Tco_0792231 [Tanacetum coccineum]
MGAARGRGWVGVIEWKGVSIGWGTWLVPWLLGSKEKDAVIAVTMHKGGPEIGVELVGIVVGRKLREEGDVVWRNAVFGGWGRNWLWWFVKEGEWWGLGLVDVRLASELGAESGGGCGNGSWWNRHLRLDRRKKRIVGTLSRWGRKDVLVVSLGEVWYKLGSLVQIGMEIKGVRKSVEGEGASSWLWCVLVGWQRSLGRLCALGVLDCAVGGVFFGGERTFMLALGVSSLGLGLRSGFGVRLWGGGEGGRCKEVGGFVVGGRLEVA